MESKQQQRTIKVLLFPYLAYGHITPFLELAKKLSLFNFTTYICSTPANLASIKKRITETHSKSIRLIELNVPSSPELPPHHHTTNGLPQHLKPALDRALRLSRPDFERILETLRPDLLIHDFLTVWSQKSASKHNVPSLVLGTTGALTFSYFNHTYNHPGTEFPFPEIRLTEFENALVRQILESRRNKDEGDRPIVLMNTSREMEEKYIDYAREVLKWKIIPIGTLVRDHSDEDDDDDDTKAIMDWLDEKDDRSTLYISFGSEYFLSRDEIEELAHGLMLSKVSFLWVIRSPNGNEGNVHDLTPKGFIEDTGDRGKIVGKFAPQDKILNHRSIGGFVSHCGWNSLIESVNYGVPIIAMPIHYDQPINAKLVSTLGVAVEVSRDESGKFDREEIARVFKDVIGGEKGEVLRRRVEVLIEKIRAASEREMENAVKTLVVTVGEV